MCPHLDYRLNHYYVVNNITYAVYVFYFFNNISHDVRINDIRAWSFDIVIYFEII